MRQPFPSQRTPAGGGARATKNTLAPGGAAPLGTSVGAPLPQSLRDDAQRRFGVDFGAVRIHAGPAAASSAQARGAAAYALGRDIVFGTDRWQPRQAAGQRLLTHELAHVVQQSQGGAVNAVPHVAEARADAAADEVLHGGRVAANSLGGAPLAPQAQPVADADAAADTFSPVQSGPPSLLPGGLPQILSTTELEAGESIAVDNPKLVQIAAAWRAQPGARVRLSAELSPQGKTNSASAEAESARLNGRLRQVRGVLQQLGVDAAQIDLQSASAFSTQARGQVAVAVNQPAARPPLSTLPAHPGPSGTIGPAVPPATPQPGFSLDLEFEYGPIKISLPKEVRAKLPMPLRNGYKLTLDLSYEVPGKFGMQLMLDGLPYLRVRLKAGTEVEAKNGSVVGSAGLVIESKSTICNAADPGETREKIKTAGDKLNKAAQEYEAALPNDKLGKAIDIASAIGELYDAGEKAKASCKQVPRATLEFGAKKVLEPGSETDPAKRPADYVGGTFTWHF